MTPYASAALTWLEAGWSPLPIKPVGDKSPYVAGHSGYKADQITDTKVKKWSKQWPEANIGIVLRSNVMVIDVDHHDGRRGGDTLAELEQRLGPLPETVVSTARELPHGHRWFRIPWTLLGGKWASKAGNDVDILWRCNRYAVSPPSIHGTAGPYRWVRHEQGWVPSVRELPFLPPAWVVHLWRGPRAASTSVVVSTPGSLTVKQNNQLRGMCVNMANKGEGGRDDCLVWCLRTARESGMDPDIAGEKIAEAAIYAGLDSDVVWEKVERFLR